MTRSLEGIPPELAAVDVEARAVRVELDEALYPLQAIYGATYVFLDRAYVLLDRPSPGRVRVTLAAKRGDLDDETARALVGELANELVSCAWRHQITQDQRAILEQVTLQAIGGAMGPPSLEELQDFDFSAETFDDPLGIAVSWEEKYKKKSPSGESATGDKKEDKAGSAQNASENKSQESGKKNSNPQHEANSENAQADSSAQQALNAGNGDSAK